MDRAAQVVRFWRTVEIFSPQDVPKLKPPRTEDSDEVVLDLAPDELAPWEPGHPVTAGPLRPGQAWRFTVYGGLYGLSAARDALVSAFGADSKYPEGRLNGKTALFAFSLDAEGYLVENSATLSACAWAISRTQSPGPSVPGWLDGFEADELGFILALNKLVPPRLGNISTAVLAESAVSKAAKVVAAQAKSAGIEAVSTGAKAAVTVATATAVGSVAGPVVGGIAGTVAGVFAEKLLTPRTAADTESETPADKSTNGDQPEETAAQLRVPRLRMTAKALHEFVADLATELGVAEVLRSTGIRVKCTETWDKNAGEAAEQNFLNSFIANDLARIERAVRRGDIGAGLQAYLTDIGDLPVAERVDVRADREAVVSGVAPRRIPSGRWPTDTSKPLVISQQFAVNQILDELAGAAGVFAVNGPPGTGKTTMLRDVLAAVVVDRAEQLAELADPLDAFTSELGSVAVDKHYTATVWGLRPELTGFEVVLATASNGAAENVTAEIPGIKAVRGQETEALAVDYFTELASQVLGSEAWGLIAGTLGNAKNRIGFADRFWFGKRPDGRKNRWASEAPDPSTGTSGSPAQQDDAETLGMMKILKGAQKQPDTVDSWAAAVAQFKKVAAEVRRLAVERQQVADAIIDFARCRARIDVAEAQFQEAEDHCNQLRETSKKGNDELGLAKAAYQDIDDEYQNHTQHKPGFWVSFSTLFRAGRRWNIRHEALAEQRTASKRDLDRINLWVSQLESELANAIISRKRHDDARDDAERDLAAVVQCIDAARERWPATVPFGPGLAGDERFQRCAPWADEEFTAARNRLFLEALRLHKTFSLRTEPRLRGNLAVIVAVLRGKLAIEPKLLLAVWQSLFLVVPMVSTTFASLPRLFAGLDREAFGWLFIDEAGQATPQQAVGGIWRCRRAVIVGDPQQLEPIVTLPSSAQHALRGNYDVAEQWTPDITSAQRIADRLARFGTSLPGQDGDSPVWIGAPLRVHRRCDRPIFDVSNTIAYGGKLMVYGTSHDGDFPGENCWIDVQSGQSNGNWIPAEGIALTHLLHELTDQGVAQQDIRVISPFRDVVRNAKAISRRQFDAYFADKNVGTIHTVQGKEADVVVLILGSKPNNDRARVWAAEKPNLLNVAVSRAKRRLYVIGNRQHWQDHSYFNELAAALPSRPHQPVPSGDRTAR
jgi:hypothetical protein